MLALLVSTMKPRYIRFPVAGQEKKFRYLLSLIKTDCTIYTEGNKTILAIRPKDVNALKAVGKEKGYCHYETFHRIVDWLALPQNWIRFTHVRKDGL